MLKAFLYVIRGGVGRGLTDAGFYKRVRTLGFGLKDSFEVNLKIEKRMHIN